MEKGAIIVKIGEVTIFTQNPYKTDEDTRKFLLERISSAIKEAEKLGLTPDQVSVKYDPAYIWDDTCSDGNTSVPITSL
jgi:hypothetical protein